MQRSTKLKLAVLALVPLTLGASLVGDEAESKYTRLTLNGKGYADQATEFISVTAATKTFSTSASGAMRDNAMDMARLRKRLARLGVAEDDFRTANFRFDEGRDPDDDDGDRAKGYLVNHQLAVVIRDVENAGEVMDALVDAGATNLSVDRYWGFSQDVNPEALKRARAAAIKDAQAQANDYAQSLGMRIRRVVSINDQGSYARERPAAAVRFAVDTRTQIDSRPSTVLASVGMVFELEK
jgi:uncharacterized protein YggE